MAKSKSSKPDAGKSDLSKAKQNGVAKAAEPAKAVKPEKQSKKSAKAPPPPESESESDAESESSANDSASGDESENSASDSASGDESDATSASDNESKTKSAKVNGSKPATNGTKKSNESDSDSESESDAEDKPAAVNGAKSAAKSDSKDDNSDASSSDGSDDDEDEEMTEPTAAVKRKAEADDESTAKKQKTGGSSGPQSLFVGNISWNVDEEWLAREFSAYGEVTGARIITDKDSGRSKGFGYVDFVNGEDAEVASKKMQEFELDGRILRVDLATSRADKPAQNPRDKFDSRAKSFGDTVSSPTETLWCGNLSFDVTAESLRENFEEYGSITRISLPTHPDSGQLKGFGYVAFSTVEEATAAFEAWKGQPLMGRPIRLDYSQPRADNGGGRGGRGGGRDFGGRGGGRDFGGRGGGGRGRGGDRGGRWTRGGPPRGGRGSSTNRGGVGDFSGSKVTF